MVDFLTGLTAFTTGASVADELFGDDGSGDATADLTRSQLELQAGMWREEFDRIARWRDDDLARQEQLDLRAYISQLQSHRNQLAVVYGSSRAHEIHQLDQQIASLTQSVTAPGSSKIGVPGAPGAPEGAFEESSGRQWKPSFVEDLEQSIFDQMRDPRKGTPGQPQRDLRRSHLLSPRTL